MDEVEALKQEIASLKKQLQQKEEIISESVLTIERLQEQLYLLQHARFGSKSEKSTGDTKDNLFDEAGIENAAEPNESDITDALEEDDETETVTYTRKKRKNNKTELPKNLPYIEKIYDLTDEEKQCVCGCKMENFKNEVTEQLDILPKTVFRVIHIRKKYSCQSCDKGIKRASRPEPLISRSIITPGLLATIVDAKFNRHLPLYRQEDIFNEMGCNIPRETMGRWVITAADKLTPIVNFMQDIILDYDVAFSDETKLQVLKEKGRKPTQKSWIWLFSGGPPDKRSFIYQYHQTRSDSVASNFFEGYQGYIHADCYSAYINLGKKKGIHHVACIAHSRRKFIEALKASKKKNGLAKKALEFIGSLYGIEENLKSEQATPETVYKVRQEQSKPILDKFHEWLLEHKPKVLPKSALGKAIFYTLRHWDSLVYYINDGRLEIDNNRSERAIKPFVIGRKNWRVPQAQSCYTDIAVAA